MKFGVIGEPCVDYIHKGDNVSDKTFGGILYSIVSLAAIAREVDDIYPIMYAGYDEYDNIISLISRYKNIKTDLILKCEQKTRIVNLHYKSSDMDISNNSVKDLKSPDRDEYWTEPTPSIEGKGLILISAHFGNWELMAFGVSQMCGEPFNIIIKEQANKLLDKKINEIRELRGNKLIDMSQSLREVLTLLRDNKIVAILGDQSAPRESLVKADFFIKNVPTFEGAARFAFKTGTKLLFGVPTRNKDYSYSLTLHEIDVCKYGEYNEENIQKLTQEHVDLLVEHIRENPDHWLWFHKRFKNVEQS